MRKMEITCIEAERGLPSWSTEIRAAGLIYEIPERTKRQKLTHVEYVVRGLYNIPQLLYDAFILRSITIANITMTSLVM